MTIARYGMLLALMCAATGISSTIARAGEPAPDIPALIAQIDQQRISDHIAAIDEPRSPFELAQLHATTDYLLAELGGLGYDITRQEVRFQGEWRGADHDVTSENVIAVKEGTQCPERIFVAGAHYDSVPASPGADDDASGVAGMLEMSRVLADIDLPATIYFTGFTLEEPGLIGSSHMAAGLDQNDAQVVGMYSLEVIG